MDSIPPDVAKKLLNRDFANLAKRVDVHGVELREVPVPEIGADDVLLEVDDDEANGLIRSIAGEAGHPLLTERRLEAGKRCALPRSALP